MINVEELSKRIVFYRAVNRISLEKLASDLKISVNTLKKIINNEHVKETTIIYVSQKMDMIERGE